jgi:hypothetical protein
LTDVPETKMKKKIVVVQEKKSYRTPHSWPDGRHVFHPPWPIPAPIRTFQNVKKSRNLPALPPPTSRPNPREPTPTSYPITAVHVTMELDSTAEDCRRKISVWPGPLGSGFCCSPVHTHTCCRSHRFSSSLFVSVLFSSSSRWSIKKILIGERSFQKPSASVPPAPREAASLASGSY